LWRRWSQIAPDLAKGIHNKGHAVRRWSAKERKEQRLQVGLIDAGASCILYLVCFDEPGGLLVFYAKSPWAREVELGGVGSVTVIEGAMHTIGSHTAIAPCYRLRGKTRQAPLQDVPHLDV